MGMMGMAWGHYGYDIVDDIVTTSGMTCHWDDMGTAQ